MTTAKPAVLFAALFLAWGATIGHTQSPRRIEIVAKKFTYDPGTITLKKGEPVVLALHSTDVAHGLKIAAFNVESDDIKKDKETEILLNPQQTGHFEGQCAHFCGTGHGNMKLQIDVVP